MTGKIITIEGLDGSGKSTQIDLLVNKLSALKIKHKFIHFPMLNKGTYGHLVAEFLRGEFGTVESVHPKLVALLFAEDRKEHINKVIDWLSKGYLVIMDRYVHSNIAFQCAKLNNPTQKKALKEWILDFEFNINKLPKPSASFFLDVPFSAIEKSLLNPRLGEDREYLNGKTDIHEDSLELQRNVHAEYIKMIDEQPNFYKIKCFSDDNKWYDPHDIHMSILKKLNLTNHETEEHSKILI